MKLILTIICVLGVISSALAAGKEIPISGGPETPDSPLDPSQYQWAVCSLSGDPHFRTFDGIRHHYQGIGTFVLVNNPLVHVQAQFRKCSSRASCFQSAIVIFGAGSAISTVEYHSRQSQVRIDTKLANLADIPTEGIVTVDGATLVKSPKAGQVVISNKARADAINVSIRSSAITLSLPKTNDYLSVTEGLCGTFDNDATNELRAFGATNATMVTKLAGNYYNTQVGTFGDSWSVCNTVTTDDLSKCNVKLMFFNKTSGVQPTWETIPETPQFASEEARAAAVAYCEKCFPGNDGAINNCELDFAILGTTAAEINSKLVPDQVTDAIETERLIKLWESIGIGLGITAGAALIGSLAVFAGSTIFFAHNPEKLPFGKKRKKIGKELEHYDVTTSEDAV